MRELREVALSLFLSIYLYLSISSSLSFITRVAPHS